VTELISSPIEKKLQTKKEAISKDEFKTPGNKRKARTSPGAPSPGEEEYGEARLEAEVQDTVIIRKRKTRPKKVCRNTEALIDFSEDSSPAESAYDLEDKENGEGGQDEDTDVMEVDEKSEEVIKNLERKDKGSKRVTRLSGKRRSVVYRISSDEEEYATSTASAGTSYQGQTKKSKKAKDKSEKKKRSTGEETCLDLTKEDEDSGQGNIERTDGRGKGLIYKLPNKIAQENRRNKMDYGQHRN